MDWRDHSLSCRKRPGNGKQPDNHEQDKTHPAAPFAGPQQVADSDPYGRIAQHAEEIPEGVREQRAQFQGPGGAPHEAPRQAAAPEATGAVQPVPRNGQGAEAQGHDEAPALGSLQAATPRRLWPEPVQEPLRPVEGTGEPQHAHRTQGR